MSGNIERAPEGTGAAAAGAKRPMERREALRRFGVYAAVTAPAMTVLLASRQSQAGGFSRNGSANRSGNSGLSGLIGGGKGGGGSSSGGSSAGGSSGGGGGGFSL